MASPPSPHVRSLRHTIKTPGRFLSNDIDMSGAPSLGRARPAGEASPADESSHFLGSPAAPSPQHANMPPRRQPRARKQPDATSSTNTTNPGRASAPKKSAVNEPTSAAMSPPAGEVSQTNDSPAGRQSTNRKATPRKATARRPAARLSSQNDFVPRKSNVPKNKYTGPVIEFDPSLRPAAFPTLDTPERAAEFERELAEQAKAGSSGLNGLSGTGASQPGESLLTPALTPHTTPKNRKRARDEDSPEAAAHDDAHSAVSHAHPPIQQDRVTPPSSDATASVQMSRENSRASKGKQPAASTTFDSVTSSIRDMNVALAHKLAGRTAHEANMAAMETSDEDEDQPQFAQETSQSLWNGIPAALRCHAMDAMGDLFPENHTLEHHMHRLRLTSNQQMELRTLIDNRSERVEMAEHAEKVLNATRREFYLNNPGKILTMEANRKLLNDTIYKHPGESLVATRGQWKALERYFQTCNLDPSVLRDGGLINDTTGYLEHDL